MRRYIHSPSLDSKRYAIPIYKGGSAAITAVKAADNLGLVTGAIVNQPNGVLGLDANGKVPFSKISNVVQGNVNITGPLLITLGANNQWSINDYDSFSTYTVSSSHGIVTLSSNQIVLNVPIGHNINTPVQLTLTINGVSRVISIPISAALPVAKPIITSPVNNATNIGVKLTATTTPFTLNSGSDTHASSDWQLSTNANFTSIVQSVTDNTTFKTSWTTNDLNVNTVYYVRVRHKGAALGYSEWSDGVQLTTKSIFNPSTEQAKLIASDGVASNWFGFSTSISADGNTLIIGAYGCDPAFKENAGAAYIFTRTGSTWTQQTKIIASDGVDGDWFGFSVAIAGDGNTCIVGAYGCDPEGIPNAGAAYIYTRSGSTWSQQAKLSASDAAQTDYFGYNVSISSNGDTCCMGAFHKNVDVGAVYIFTRSGTIWTQQAKLVSSDGVTGDWFGISTNLSSDGNTCIIGAYGCEIASIPNAGAAYVFSRSGSTWSQQAKLSASDAAQADYFGYSVTISSDSNTCCIGAHSANPDNINDAGAAYIFTRSGSTWTQQAKLTASDKISGDNFGISAEISTDGNVCVIGAYGCAVNSAQDAGAAYIFTRSGSTWTQQAKLIASDYAEGAYFGLSVSIDAIGSICCIGAAYSSPSGKVSAGSAYIFI